VRLTEMIQITYNQLADAAFAGTLTRFFACGLTVPAWKVTRHTPAAAATEMTAFEKKRNEVVAKYEGKPKPGGLGWDFPTPEKAKAFGAEFADLLKVEIELPGDKIKVDDILTFDAKVGPLTPQDSAKLAPFLVDE